jgi:hypothetical protein
MQASFDSRKKALLLSISVLFLTASVGAWSWFHVNPHKFSTVYEFTARTNIQGFSYVPEALNEKVTDILATTNIVSGRFSNKDGELYTVFLGDWSERSARQMTVVGHTPDICWVEVGWKILELGQPDKVILDFGGTKIPFECRVFKDRDGRQVELAVWCTIVSGQVFEEGERFISAEDDKRKNLYTVGRQRSVTMFLNAVSRRIPSTGTKQFVRFSVPVHRDWHLAVAQVKAFADKWLELKISNPSIE